MKTNREEMVYYQGDSKMCECEKHTLDDFTKECKEGLKDVMNVMQTYAIDEICRYGEDKILHIKYTDDTEYLVDMKSTTKNYPTPRHIDLFGDDMEPD